MILLIDNYDSFTYNLYQLAASLGAEVCVIRNDQITIEEMRKLPIEGIILSPGPGGPLDSGICMDVIRIFGEAIPILGVCLGHQAIGEVYGAKIERAKHPMHGKMSLIFHNREDLFRDMVLPFQAGRYHSLEIDSGEFPSDLVITARTGDGAIMGIRHKVFPIFGIQFHPESILTPEGSKLMQAFLEICKHCEAVC